MDLEDEDADEDGCLESGGLSDPPKFALMLGLRRLPVFFTKWNVAAKPCKWSGGVDLGLRFDVR